MPQPIAQFGSSIPAMFAVSADCLSVQVASQSEEGTWGSASMYEDVPRTVKDFHELIALRRPLGDTWKPIPLEPAANGGAIWSLVAASQQGSPDDNLDFDLRGNASDRLMKTVRVDMPTAEPTAQLVTKITEYSRSEHPLAHQKTSAKTDGSRIETDTMLVYPYNVLYSELLLGEPSVPERRADFARLLSAMVALFEPEHGAILRFNDLRGTKIHIAPSKDGYGWEPLIRAAYPDSRLGHGEQANKSGGIPPPTVLSAAGATPAPWSIHFVGHNDTIRLNRNIVTSRGEKPTPAFSQLVARTRTLIHDSW